MIPIICKGNGLDNRCGHALSAHGPKGCPWCSCRLGFEKRGIAR